MSKHYGGSVECNEVFRASHTQSNNPYLGDKDRRIIQGA